MVAISALLAAENLLCVYLICTFTSSFTHFSYCLARCVSGWTWAPQQNPFEGLMKIDFCLKYGLNLVSTSTKIIDVRVVALPRSLSVQMKLRTHSSSFAELPQPMSTDGCGPFANYQSPQVSVHLNLNLVQHAYM